jgi:hypothetical protein
MGRYGEIHPLPFLSRFDARYFANAIDVALNDMATESIRYLGGELQIDMRSDFKGI